MMSSEMSDGPGAVADNQPLFVDLDPDDDDGVTELDSLCMHCYKQGTTRLMLTRIPFFKEVIISSFTCDSCGYKDSSVQSGGRIQDKGEKYTVNIQNKKDLNRQVIKSDTATLSIPALNFEQPPSKKGEVNTVEGLIDAIVRGLEQDQPTRRALQPDVADKIEEFMERLQALKKLDSSFDIVLDDPTGNSFVENPWAPKQDDAISIEQYMRSKEQEIQLGIRAEDETGEVPEASNAEPKAETTADQKDNEGEKGEEKTEELNQEVLQFPTNCPNCNSPCITNMKTVNIPFFKEVIIMATNCDACGNRENEVKSGSGIEPLGKRITLHITDPSDLNRDILKSDTCAVKVPELELELGTGTLGGRFTTIEGLFQQIKEELGRKNPFFMGDSAESDTKTKMDAFLAKVDEVISGQMLDIHVILDDPAGNSFVQNVYAPDLDPEMKVENYTRSEEDDDTLGILEMKTENYTTEES